MFSKSQKYGMAFLALLMVVSFATANSQPGDCNGDGVVDIPDATMLVHYLFSNGPPVTDFTDCDCDGFQGLNYADLIQLILGIYAGGTLYAYPGEDFLQTSNVKLFFNKQVDFSANPPVDEIEIHIDVPVGFDIYCLILPFSFMAETGQTDISVSNVDFTGSVAGVNMLSADIRNPEEMFILIDDNLMYVTPVIMGGSRGLLCTVIFTQDGPLAGPNDLRLHSKMHRWPMLITRPEYNGTNGIRMFLPEFIRAPYGDCNSDQTVNVSDAVYIINYVFVGGPVPGNKEP